MLGENSTQSPQNRRFILSPSRLTAQNPGSTFRFELFQEKTA
jgi:hypothetical protein